MDPYSDSQLLRMYATEHAEEAFTELVRRHVGLVFGVALRRTGGDSALAEDIAQRVFAHLATYAPRLPSGVVLPGWLYRHTSFVAATTLRSEARRRQRECVFAAMNSAETDNSQSDWTQVAPVLDDALAELSDRDRDALVLRFFESHPLREIGVMLGVSEDAARMRIERALERLHDALGKRGVRTASDALGITLSTHAIGVVPGALVASVSAGALTAAGVSAVSPAFAHSILNTLIMTKVNSLVVAGLVIAAGSTLLLQLRTNGRLRKDNARLAETLRVLEVPSPAANAGPQDSASPKVAVASSTNTAPFDWRRVESSDYRQYVANLRAVGCPEKTLRDIIVADVHDLYRQRIREAMPTNRHEYWKAGQFHDQIFEPGVVHKLNALKEEQRTLLQTLAGGSFVEATDALQSQLQAVFTERTLDFLSPERVAPVLELEQKFSEQMVLARTDNSEPALRAQALKQLAAKRETVLLELLSPEEKFEYELRVSQTAASIRTGLGNFQPSEQEFREMFRLQKRFDDEFAPGGVRLPENTTPRIVQAESALQDGFLAVLGEERYRQYRNRNH